jgi:N-acyl homoserine lactone hydrolase
VKLWLLDGGILDADRSVVHPGDDSHRRVSLPIPQILIESDGRRILVDTGVPPVAAGDSEGLQREYEIDPVWIKPMLRRENRLDAQLAKVGLQPSELDLVINTHMHFDHAGSNSLFVGVPIAVQEAELEAAQESESYLPVWDAPGLQFRPVRGDWEPAPGVKMLHTPGHQSMLVRVGSQPWLFTCDAVYTEEHWREGKLGAVKDVAAARASIARIRELASRENARLIFGHDIAQWQALGMGDRAEPRLVAWD